MGNIKKIKERIFLVIVSIILVLVAVSLVFLYLDGAFESDDENIQSNQGVESCIQTFSNPDYPKFSFKYDSCKWEITENSKELKLNDNEMNLLEVRLVTENSAVTIEVEPWIGFGIGEGAVCVERYEEISSNIYRLTDGTLISNEDGQQQVLAYSYRRNFDIRGSHEYEEDIDKYSDTNYFFNYSTDLDRYGITMIADLTLSERREKFAGCSRLEIFDYTDTIYKKSDYPEYFDSAEGNIDGLLVISLDSKDEQEIKEVDEIVKSITN